MTLAILFKRDRLDIFDNINVVSMENGKLLFTSGAPNPATCSSVHLDEVSMVTVNGIVYYANGEVGL